MSRHATITIEDLENLSKRAGIKRSTRFISTLGKQAEILTALETKVGNELLHAAIDRLEEILDKIVDESADEKELAEYRVLKLIVEKWSSKIIAYYKNLNSIKGGTTHA